MNKEQLHQALDNNTFISKKDKGNLKKKVTYLVKQFTQQNQYNRKLQFQLVQQINQSQTAQEIDNHIINTKQQALSSNNIIDKTLNKFNLKTQSKVQELQNMIDTQDLSKQQTNQLYKFINKLNTANSSLNFLSKNNNNNKLVTQMQTQINKISPENIFLEQPDFFKNEFYQDKLPINKYNKLLENAHNNSVQLRQQTDLIEKKFSTHELQDLYLDEVFIFTKVERSKISNRGIEFDKNNNEIPKEQRQEIYGMTIKFTEGKQIPQVVLDYFIQTNYFLPINVILESEMFTQVLITFLQQYNEFTTLKVINSNHYFMVRFVNGKMTKVWLDSMQFFINVLMNSNQQPGDDDFYGTNQNLVALVLAQILTKEKGAQYQTNEQFEKRYQTSILLVRNTDTKCLAAATFLSLLISKKINTSFVIILNQQKYEVNEKYFSKTSLMQSYEQNDKKNLYFYTNLFIETLKIKTDYDNITEAQMQELVQIHFKKSLFIIHSVEEDLPQSKDQIIIYRYDNHYCVVKDYLQFIRKHYNSPSVNYCFEHKQTLKTRNLRCKLCDPNQFVCKICKQFHKENLKIENFVCNICNQKFNTSVKCFEKHQLWHQKVKNEACSYCNEIHVNGNQCAAKLENDLLQFKEASIKKELLPFIVYDIESYFETNLEDSEYQAEHIPFLLCYQVILVKDNQYELQQDKQFMTNNDLVNSQYKNQGMFILEDSKDKMWAKFIQIVLALKKSHKISSVYAHNGGKYDNILLLNYLQSKKSCYTFDPLFNQGRLLQLKMNGIVFKDSINILTFPLAQFNKNLNLDEQQKKYGLDSTDKMFQDYDKVDQQMIQDYIANKGQIINFEQLYNQDLFSQAPYNSMNEQEINQFLQKYGKTDFIDYYISYCIQDTMILALGLIEWSNVTIKLFKNNILNFLTLPSFSYQSYLQYSGVHLFQAQTNLGNFNVSKVEKEVQTLIMTNLKMFNCLVNESFVKLEVIDQNVKFDDNSNYNVDLIVQNEKLQKFIIEIDGNYWHGLDFDNVYDKNQKIILKERFRKHQLKAEYLDNNLQDKYVKVIHIIESEFNQFKKDYKIKIDLDCTKLVGNQFCIENRSILRGGSTSPLYNYIKIDNTKQCLKGYDLTSLYPSMMLKNLPLGECIIDYSWKYVLELIEYSKLIKKQNLDKQFEMCCLSPESWDNKLIQVKCAILPPQDLEIPSLNVKICDKLLSPLCRTCAEQQCKNVQNNKQCEHSQEERMLIGFFDQSELLLALTQKYKIINVYETYLYQQTTFNTKDYKGNQYIMNLIFYKTIYSDKNDYNEQVLDQLVYENIIYSYKYENNELFLKQLKDSEFMKVQLNSAQKNLYKLSMNALYGKTGQDQVRVTQNIDRDYTFLERTYNENIHKDLSYQQIKDTDSSLYSFREPYDLQILNKTQSNASLAGRITSLSRVCLYFLISKIQQEYNGKVIYHDTDSAYSIMDIKYKSMQGFSMKGTFGIKAEEKLHDANEFICLAPKCYAYSDQKDFYATSKGICLIKSSKNTRTVNVFNYYGDMEQQETLQKQQKLEQKELLECYRDKDYQHMFDNQNVTAFSIYKEIILDINKYFFVQQDNNFVKDIKTRQIYKQKNIKILRYNERKRVAIQIDQDVIYTLPFGFIIKKQ